MKPGHIDDTADEIARECASGSVSSSCYDSTEDFLEEAGLSDDQSLDSFSPVVLGARFSPILKSFGSDVIKYLKIELQDLLQSDRNFTTHTEPSRSDSAPVWPALQTNTDSSHSQNSIGKRPLYNEGSGSADEHENERPRKRPKNSPSDLRSGEVCLKLACPFFKNKPSKYQSWTSCPGPGWDSVHRVK